MGLLFAIKATLLPCYLQFSIQSFIIKHFRSMAHILLLFGNSGSRTAHKANQELNLKTPFSSHILALFFFFLSVLFFFTTFFIPLSLICSFRGPASRQVRGGSTFYTLRFFFCFSFTVFIRQLH